MNRRVVVTGAGGVTALGDSWADCLAGLKEGNNRIRYMPEWDIYPELNTRLAAPIDSFTVPKHLPRKSLRSMGRVAQLGVVATERAIESAGLTGTEVLGSAATGVAYGSATGSSDAALEFFGLLNNQSMRGINGTTYVRMMSHTAAVNISVFFATEGRLITTSTACTAGSQGIGYAYEAIRGGQQTIMLAGGAEELCPSQAAVFDVLYATSTKNEEAACSPRPFDTDRDGLVIGEGAATLVLEELEHAQKRGANILAEVVGFATNTDGAHLTQPQQGNMETVMRAAIKDAGIDPAEIAYVSAHGTATDLGDVAESRATEAVFQRPVAISSLKSYLGHSLGACGAIEAWLTIMMMREKCFAPTLNLTTIDPRCAELNYLRSGMASIDTGYVMSNNFAFGGVNTSLIFKLPH